MKTKAFCNFCNSPLDVRFVEGKDRQVCSACGEVYYENPLPVVAVIVANEKREILLVKRAREPSKDMWCFPVGFAESGESIEAAAIRELKEEAGINGRIVQVVDVGSDFTTLYGELLVITYEAEKIGGHEEAGDDAAAFGYFPIAELPDLAFDSQERALTRFVELKRDTWNMSDSFERFVKGRLNEETVFTGDLLSDELLGAIEGNAGEIIELWLADLAVNPSTAGYHSVDRKELFTKAIYIIGQLRTWLKDRRTEEELKQFYYDLGRLRRLDGVSIEELISSLSLLKKQVFRYVSSTGTWKKPVDMYRVFEMGERLVGFFDRAAYYSTVGYGRE